MRLHQLQKTADQVGSAVRDQATELAHQAREGLVRGRETVSDWEHELGLSVRKNPLLYAGAAMVVVGLALVLTRPRWHKSENAAE